MTAHLGNQEEDAWDTEFRGKVDRLERIANGLGRNRLEAAFVELGDTNSEERMTQPKHGHGDDEEPGAEDLRAEHLEAMRSATEAVRTAMEAARAATQAAQLATKAGRATIKEARIHAEIARAAHATATKAITLAAMAGGATIALAVAIISVAVLLG